MKRIRPNNINTQARYKKIIEGTDIAKIGFNPKWAEVLYKSLLSEGNILDVGCWKGEHLNYWCKKNPKLIPLGIDFSIEALDFSKKNFPNIKVQIGDVTKKLEFPDNFFDMVVCLEVLEHLEKPEETIKEIIRVARNRIVVSVPWELEVKSPYHVWEFNKQDFQELFKDLKNVRIDHVGARMIMTGDKNVC